MLPHDARCSAGRAGNDKKWREHCGGPTHHVIAHRREPIEVWKYLFGIPHDRLEALGNVIYLSAAANHRELVRDFLDDLVARVGDGCRPDAQSR